MGYYSWGWWRSASCHSVYSNTSLQYTQSQPLQPKALIPRSPTYRTPEAKTDAGNNPHDPFHHSFHWLPLPCAPPSSPGAPLPHELRASQKSARLCGSRNPEQGCHGSESRLWCRLDAQPDVTGCNIQYMNAATVALSLRSFRRVRCRRCCLVLCGHHCTHSPFLY